jgi:hypothetical protein
MHYMSLVVYPIVQLEDGRFNITGEFLTQIWEHLQAQGKVEQLFYDGHIRSAEDFIAYLTSPGVFPLLVIDEKKRAVVHVAWLKDTFDGCAWAHHVSIGPYRRGAWETVRDYWKQLGLIHLLLGLTPAHNSKAVRFLKKVCKFTVVGEVPWVCNMAYEGKRSPGIVSYYELIKDEVRPEVEAAPDAGGQIWVEAAAEKVEAGAAAAQSM